MTCISIIVYCTTISNTLFITRLDNYRLIPQYKPFPLLYWLSALCVNNYPQTFESKNFNL